MSNDNQKQVFYVRESAMQSIIADTVSFGFLILVMTLNFLQWGGHWYVTIFLLVLWLVFVAGKANNKIKRFPTRSDLVDHLIKELEEEGDNSK